MRRLYLSLAKLVVALVMFMSALSPVYSQEMLTSQVDADQTVGSRFALSAGGTPAAPVNHSAKPDTVANLETGTSQTTSSQTTTSQTETATQLPGATQTPSATHTPGASQAPSATQTPSAAPTPTPTTTPFVFPTRRERFNRYVKSTVGPFTLLNTAVSAGISQWRDSPEEWEQGMSGYGKRFASGFGSNAIQQTVVYGLDSALGLDTRFRKSTQTEFFPRMKDALIENITSRTKSGKRVFSVPRISGVYASSIISRETWYPDSYNYKDGLRSGTRSLLTGFGMNLIREFVINF